jgi:hypothetical protein
MTEPAEPPVEVNRLELLEALAKRVEGLRNQFSMFSDTVILEIKTMKRWLAVAIDEEKSK